MRKVLFSILLLGVAVSSFAQQLSDFNWSDRRQIIANVCPDIKITSFTFGSAYERIGGDRFVSRYAWENIGQKEIVAFELVILRYDPFNRPQIGVVSIFPGHNSATYKPLKPGESDSDGGSSLGDDKIYTAVVYIRNVRFSDNTIWSAASADVVKSIKTQVPDILEVGPLAPEKKKSESGN